MLPTPVVLPGESHEQRSLVDYSPWGRKESDTTDHVCTSCTKTSSGFPLLLHYGVLYHHFLIYHNAMIIEIKCIVNMLE